MHRVIKSFLTSFVEQFQLDEYDEGKQFEFFCQHCIVQPKVGNSLDGDELAIDRSDNGIDGLAVIVDGDLILSLEDITNLFEHSARKFEVEIIFIQAKGGERFDLAMFSRFCSGVSRFSTEFDVNFNSDYLNESQSIFKFILDNAPKVRDSLPKFTSYYVTTGRFSSAKEWEAEKTSLITKIANSGYYREPEVHIWGHDELTKCWNNLSSGYKAKLPARNSAPLPEMPAVNEAYLAVVKAKDLVQELLIGPDGSLRTQVFEENVRAFLGSENPINKKISETINSDYQTRFAVLNNGVTIVSPDVNSVGNNFHLKNYQIVNGCQTCNVLYHNRDKLNDLSITVKIVETQDEDVFVQLVNATNSQTKVENSQFKSLSPVVRRVENYFKAIEDDEDPSCLYFERRDKQFVGTKIPNLRIYSLKEATRCVAAMFLERPELASRFPIRMLDELGSELYDHNVHEISYYAACVTMHRFKLLRSNRQIPQNYQKLKWHFLPLVRMSICGENRIALTDKKIKVQCEQIIDKLSHHNSDATKIFEDVSNSMSDYREVALDKLKSLQTFRDMKENFRLTLKGNKKV